ncbi:MAG: DUF2793 domain-containing protein [Paracoccaceae bacterium]
MSETSPNLNLPYLQPSQAQKHVTHNLALQILDALTQLSVEGVNENIPPVSASEGETWATGPAPLGLWAGQPDQIAIWTNGSWMFIPTRDGVLAFDKSSNSLLVRINGAWVSAGGATSPSLLGVNATADVNNRLAVSSNGTLLNHEGAGHQLKMNKSDSSDTASLLYQTDFSGRAEMGLAGSDNWSIKVSPDGTSWSTALEIDASDASVSGASLQAFPADTGVGKLARADFVYGPGNVVGTVSETGGLPTGAVIEQGSSVNGTYTRFADGTQICQTDGADFVYIEGDFLRNSWTYPAPFSASPGVQSTLSRALTDYTDTTPFELGPITSNFSTTNVVMELYRSAGIAAFASTAEVRNVRITAIGRWF